MSPKEILPILLTTLLLTCCANPYANTSAPYTAASTQPTKLDILDAQINAVKNEHNKLVAVDNPTAEQIKRDNELVAQYHDLKAERKEAFDEMIAILSLPPPADLSSTRDTTEFIRALGEAA